MKFKSKAAVFCLVVLSACSSSLSGSQNADGFGTGGAGVANPASVAYFQQSVGDRVLFVVNQNTLTPDAIQILNGQANWLLEYTDRTVVIEGHADEQGTRAYNLALGARRASAVQNYLISRGVADSRIRTVTYGKERPIEICSNESCWSKNRRAVTVVASGLNS